MLRVPNAEPQKVSKSALDAKQRITVSRYETVCLLVVGVNVHYMHVYYIFT